MTATVNRAEQAGKVLAPGAGEAFSLMGIRIVPKVTAEDSGGAFTLLEETAAPGAGSPPHICHAEDKTIYVVQGEFAVLVGDEVRTVAAGGTVYLPRGIAHNFRNVGTEPGRIVVALTPGGHERFLRHLSQLGQGGAPDMEQMAQVSQAYDVEILPPTGP